MILMVMDPMGMGCFFPNEKFQKGEQDFLEGETKRLRDVTFPDPVEFIIEPQMSSDQNPG